MAGKSSMKRCLHKERGITTFAVLKVTRRTFLSCFSCKFSYIVASNLTKSRFMMRNTFPKSSESPHFYFIALSGLSCVLQF